VTWPDYCPRCDSEDCKCGYLNELESEFKLAPPPDPDELVRQIEGTSGPERIADILPVTNLRTIR
jgi:hypothetical protein